MARNERPKRGLEKNGEKRHADSTQKVNKRDIFCGLFRSSLRLDQTDIPPLFSQRRIQQTLELSYDSHLLGRRSRR